VCAFAGTPLPPAPEDVMIERIALALVLLPALAATSARADVLTVGPTGAFARVEDAFAHAVSLPASGTHQIRIAEGLFKTHVVVPPGCCTGKTLVVFGGWNADFSSYRVDPLLTVLDGGADGRILDVPSMTTGTIALLNLTVRNGLVHAPAPHAGLGGGIRAALGGNARLVLSFVHVRGNAIQAEAAGPTHVFPDTRGAGMYVELRDAAVVQVEGSAFDENEVRQVDYGRANASGVGLHLQMVGGSAAVRSSLFSRNRVGPLVPSSNGEGLFAHVANAARLTVEDVTFDANGPATGVTGSTAAVWTFGSSGTGTAASIARCRFTRNTGAQQLQVRTLGTRNVVVSDTLVASGRSGGVGATAWGGRIHLTNLTVTAHPRAGIQTAATSGTVTLHNSVAYGNTPNLGGSPTAVGFNLLGVDPLFVDAAAGDYRLSLASPAIDEGTNTPPAGLGPTDADGNPRVANGRVDVGAFERAH
jgi:hypothetical protein